MSARTRRSTRRPEAIHSVLIREDAGAWWYDVAMSDGRTIRMSVPKKEAE